MILIFEMKPLRMRDDFTFSILDANLFYYCATSAGAVSVFATSALGIAVSAP